MAAEVFEDTWQLPVFLASRTEVARVAEEVPFGGSVDDAIMESDGDVDKVVNQGLDGAAAFARSLDPVAFRSGDWFVQLVRHVARTYNRNARAAYFQNKYRGLPPDDIADALVSTSVRYAAITGGITGAAVTANQFIAIPTGGLSIALVTGVIGSEMVYLSRIQMQLVLDLATIYGESFDAEDPEDMLTVFGYALGAAPVEALGKVAQRAAAHGTSSAVKSVVSKGTLKAVQDIGRRLGVRILQRTIIKFCVPVASAAVGSGYNYYTTSHLGAIAKAHMRNRGRSSQELRSLLTTNTADVGLALPAAMMVMATADGVLQTSEKELYRALLSNIAQDEGAEIEFQRLLRDRGALLAALGCGDAPEMRAGIVEALGLMAAYDGDASEAEVAFLREVATHLGVEVDLAALARQAQGYRVEASGVRSMARVREAAQLVAHSGMEIASAVGEHVRKGASRAGTAAAEAGAAGAAAAAAEVTAAIASARKFLWRSDPPADSADQAAADSDG